MKVAYTEDDFTKLCHAKPGQVIVLVNALMERGEGPFMVCVVPDANKRAARENVTNGLYDEERRLFLVHLETGEMRDTPNLSSRAIIYDETVVRLAQDKRGKR